MLSFVLKNDGKTLEVDADDSGLKFLISKLQELIGTSSHIHLNAPRDISGKDPWGEIGISEVILSSGGD